MHISATTLNLSDFDKGQIVVARWLGQSISKMASPVGSEGQPVWSNHKEELL